MNFDEMIATWRAQDEAPLYGVNRDLLRLVVQNEQADLRRNLQRDQWSLYGLSAGLLAVFGFFFLAFYYDDDPRTVSDYVVAGIGTIAMLVWSGAVYTSRKRQSLRERRFGNSLQDEIHRNLSLVEYQLSRTGKRALALLVAAPVALAGSLIYWLVIQINNNPFGLFDASMIVFIVVTSAMSVMDTSRNAEKDLLPRKRRLSELLVLLEA